MLKPEDVSDRIVFVGISATLADAGFWLPDQDSIEVHLPILPAEYRLSNQLEKEIALEWRDLEKPDESRNWKLATQRARFGFRAVGIFETEDASSELWIAQSQRIRNFLKENLWVYVDVSERGEGENQLPVRFDLKRDWKESFPEVAEDQRAELEAILESEPLVTLVEKTDG